MVDQGRGSAAHCCMCPALGRHRAFRSRYRLSCEGDSRLGMDRVDVARSTAWLNQTKNRTSRGVPLNRDAVAVLDKQVGKHPPVCFTYRGQPIRYELTNAGWKTACKKAELADFRFHDLRHTWASWHRQAGTSCDELKDLGGWKSRVIVDRYAKFGTEHLFAATSRIENCVAFSPQQEQSRKVIR